MCGQTEVIGNGLGLPQHVFLWRFSPAPCFLLSFFPFISVCKTSLHTQRRLPHGVELVGAIGVLGHYESERFGAACRYGKWQWFTPTPHNHFGFSVFSDGINLARL